MRFEVLCMDNKETVKSKKLDSLILAFRANDTLWNETIDVAQNTIEYIDKSLCVFFSEFDTTKFAVGNRFIPA